jgi:hypothetical protein
LRLDEIVYESKSFQRIMADEKVTDEEVAAQGNLVVKLFHEIETKLSEKDKELVIQAISELAVLYEINAHKGGK